MVIARAWPRPVGSGALMWNASAVSAPPMISAIGVAPRARRVRERLDDDDAGALAEHEPVARRVERPRGASPGRRCASTARSCSPARPRPSAQIGASEPPARTTSHSPVADQPQRVVEGDDRRRAGGDLGDDRARSGRTPSTACRRAIEPDRAGTANGLTRSAGPSGRGRGCRR